MFLWLLIALQIVHAQFPPQCQPQSIQNGAFESGQMAPWYDPARRSPEIANFTIVSPGDQGRYALQLDFPAANVTSQSLVNPLMGRQCNGGQYLISFAINWVNFPALEGDPAKNFCQIDVSASYCFRLPGEPLPAPGFYNATSTPGWQAHNYICTAHKDGGGDFVLDIGCETTYIMPAFTYRVTDFSIKLVGYSAASSSSSTLSTPTPSQSYSSQSSPTPTLSLPYSSQSYTSQPAPFQSTPSQSTGGSATLSSSILSSSSNSPTSLPSNIVPGSVADRRYQALEISFFLCPLSLVLLLFVLE